MSRRSGLAFLLAAIVAVAGCRRSTSSPAAPESAAQVPTAAAASPAVPPSTTAAAPDPSAARLELGYESDGNGAIPRGLESRQFAAASKFALAVRTSDLSENAKVTVRWTDAGSAALATETRTVAAGSSFVSFASPDTTTWQTATYRVAVEIDDRPAGTLEFRIEAVAGAGS